MKDKVLETLMDLGLKDVAKFTPLNNPIHNKHIASIVDYMLDPNHSSSELFKQNDSVRFHVGSRRDYNPSLVIADDDSIRYSRPTTESTSDTIMSMLEGLNKIFYLTNKDIKAHQNVNKFIFNKMELNNIANLVEGPVNTMFTQPANTVIENRLATNSNVFFNNRFVQELVKFDSLHTFSYVNIASLNYDIENTIGYPLYLDYRLKQKIAQGLLFELIGSNELNSSNPKNILTDITYIGHIQYNDIQIVGDITIGDVYTYYVYSYNTLITAKTQYIVLRTKLSASVDLPIGDFKLTELTITSTGNNIGYIAEEFKTDIIVSPFISEITTLEEEEEYSTLIDTGNTSDFIEKQITVINSVFERCRNSVDKLEVYVQHMSLILSKIGSLFNSCQTSGMYEGSTDFWNCFLNDIFINATVPSKDLLYKSSNGNTYNFSQMLYGMQTTRTIFMLADAIIDAQDYPIISAYEYAKVVQKTFLEYLNKAIHFGNFNKHFIPEVDSISCIPRDVLAYKEKICKEQGIDLPIDYKGFSK